MAEIKDQTGGDTFTTDLFALHEDLSKMEFIKSADNPFFKSKYLDLPSLLKAVKPVLKKHGFVWYTAPGYTGDNEPTLAYHLLHKDGQAINGSMLLQLKSADPQGQGSAITYGRRYTLTAVLDIAADDDDDGNKGNEAAKASGERTDRVTEKYIGAINGMLEKTGKPKDTWEGKPLSTYKQDQLIKIGKALAAEVEEQ